MKKKKKSLKLGFWIAIAIVLILALVVVKTIYFPASTGNETTNDTENNSDEVPIITGDTVVEADESTEETDESTEETDESTEETEVDTEVVEEVTTVVVDEGDLVSFPNLKAVDPDGDALTIEFSEPLDSDGTWQTEEGDAGQYDVTITISDGIDSVSEDIMLVVESINKAPTILTNEIVIVDEGELVVLEVDATDPEDDPVEISFSGWMDENTKQTTYDDAGTHKVTIMASDGEKEAKTEIIVVVNNVNRKPTFVSII